MLLTRGGALPTHIIHLTIEPLYFDFFCELGFLTTIAGEGEIRSQPDGKNAEKCGKMRKKRSKSET
jgi:hypothetical protein